MVGYMTENDGLALKLFQEICCDGCSCKSENDHKPKEDRESSVWQQSSIWD